MKSIFLGLYLYNMLCKGSLDPAMSYAKAGAVVLIDNFIMRKVYFWTRKSFTGGI
jgi:hypothetical protein